MGFDQLPSDSESQAGPAAIASARLVTTPEAVKEMRHVCGWDTGSGVSNLDQQAFSIGLSAERHNALRWRVAQGIGEQIGEDLFDAVAIDHNVGKGRSELDLKGDIALGRQGSEFGNGAFDKGARIDNCFLERKLACIGERQGPQVLNKPVEKENLFMDWSEVGCIGGKNPILDRLDLPPDHAQWRPKFMCDIGCHAPTQLIGSGQVVSHTIERVGELANLIFALNLGTTSEVAGCDLFGSLS
jgi:hypothetical protein